MFWACSSKMSPLPPSAQRCLVLPGCADSSLPATPLAPQVGGPTLCAEVRRFGTVTDSQWLCVLAVPWRSRRRSEWGDLGGTMLAGAKAVASLVSANAALEELVLSANRLGCTWDSAKNEFVNNPSGVIPLSELPPPLAVRMPRSPRHSSCGRMSVRSKAQAEEPVTRPSRR